MNTLAQHMPQELLVNRDNTEAFLQRTGKTHPGGYQHPLRQSYIDSLTSWLHEQPDMPNRQLMLAVIRELLATHRGLEAARDGLRHARMLTQDCIDGSALSVNAKRELERVVRDLQSSLKNSEMRAVVLPDTKEKPDENA